MIHNLTACDLYGLIKPLSGDDGMINLGIIMNET